MNEVQAVKSRGLEEIASPHLNQVPALIYRARVSITEIGSKIQVLRKRQAKLHRRLKRAGAGKREVIEDEVMQLEILLRHLLEEKAWWEKRTDLPKADTASFDSLRGAFEQLMLCRKIWDVTARKEGKQYRSLATGSLKRMPVDLGLRLLASLDRQQRALHFSNANGADLFIFPHVLAVQETHRGPALIDLKNIRLEFCTTGFVEDEQVPSDARVIGHTWRYTNNDGSRDRRFRDNYQIPIAEYGQLDFRSTSGLNERYLISDAGPAENFAQAFAAYQQSAENFPIVLFDAVTSPAEEIVERRRLIDQLLPMLPEKKGHGKAVALVVALSVLIGLIGYFTLQSDFNLTDLVNSTEEVAVMPQRLDVTPDRVVGDSGRFSLTVIAVHDKLSPIRATVDQDVRRPYWIEQGEAVQFNWNDQLILEGDLPVVQLTVSGYRYRVPVDNDKLIVTDSIALSFLASLQQQNRR